MKTIKEKKWKRKIEKAEHHEQNSSNIPRRGSSRLVYDALL